MVLDEPRGVGLSSPNAGGFGSARMDGCGWIPTLLLRGCAQLLSLPLSCAETHAQLQPEEITNAE
jgi:hypothetical protein